MDENLQKAPWQSTQQPASPKNTPVNIDLALPPELQTAPKKHRFPTRTATVILLIICASIISYAVALASY